MSNHEDKDKAHFDQTRLTDLDSWFRALFMLGFSALLYIVVAPVVFVLMITQFIFRLLNGEGNQNLQEFNRVVVEYVTDTLRFMMFETDDKPFPFAPLPGFQDRAADPTASQGEADVSPSRDEDEIESAELTSTAGVRAEESGQNEDSAEEKGQNEDSAEEKNTVGRAEDAAAKP